MFDGGINPFISGIVYEEKGEVKFDSEALISRMLEFSEILNPKKLFVGKDKGFMKEWDSEIAHVKKSEFLSEKRD